MVSVHCYCDYALDRAFTSLALRITTAIPSPLSITLDRLHGSWPLFRVTWKGKRTLVATTLSARYHAYVRVDI